jgi:hypothetical protein
VAGQTVYVWKKAVNKSGFCCQRRFWSNWRRREHNVRSLNGIVLSADEKFLFVAVTWSNCVWRMPLLVDGSVSKTGQFFTYHGPAAPMA